MVTSAPRKFATRYKALGLELEYIDNEEKCIIYFTPNQIFFMLTAYRMATLKEKEQLEGYDWFIASSITTTRSLDELAQLDNIPVIHVKVGFKYWGELAGWIENRRDEKEFYIDALNKKVFLAKNPRLIIMCEESGGAIFGGTKLLANKETNREIVALCEKDGFQFGFLALSLSAYLSNRNISLAEYYCDLITKNRIKNRFFKRYDRILYDESLTGSKRQEAKNKGFKLRDQVIAFFRNLAIKHSEGATLTDIQKEINKRVPPENKLLPRPHHITIIGEGSLLEGTYMEFATFWCIIRVSGTDALIRYYFEGQDSEEIESYKDSLIKMHI